MLTRVQFEQYRILRSVDTTLEPLTILVGPNGVGKSTFMEAVWRSHNSLKDRNFSSFKSTKHNDPNKMVTPQNVRLTFQSFYITFEHFSPTEITPLNDSFNQIDFNHWTLRLRMSPDAIRQSASKNTNLHQFPLDGRGLLAFLANLRLTETNERFDFMLKAVQAVVPDVDQILINSTSVRTDYKLEMKTKSGTKIGAEHISDGTLCTIGLITALAWARTQGEEGLILIDDIDSDLHPKAQGELMRQIRSLMAHLPGLQIIASTHSPYLLDHVKAEEVRILTASPETGTRIAKLTDHADYERWKDEMSPGEFWSTVGEDWVKDWVKK